MITEKNDIPIITDTVDKLAEKIQECQDFETLAMFKLSQLDIIKAAVKKLSDTVNAQMCYVGGSVEIGDNKVYIGTQKKKKIDLRAGLDAVWKAGAYDQLPTLLSTSAFKPAEYRRFAESSGIGMDAYNETETDKVEVKQINKKFLKGKEDA